MLLYFFGIKQFSYFHIQNNGLTLIMNSNQDHLEYYLQNDHHKYDPHIVHPSNILPGIALCESYENKDYQGSCLFLARQMFGLDHGITCVRKNVDYYHAYNFTTYTANKIHRKYFNDFKYLEYFINCFEEKQSELCIDINTYVDMTHLKGEEFFSQQGITCDSFTDKQRKAFLDMLN